MLRRTLAPFASAILVMVSAAASMAATLTADSMRYDPFESKLFASGSVRLETASGTITSDEAEGTSDGISFEFSGVVRATLVTQDGDVDVACERLEIDRSSGSDVITAHDRVVVARGADLMTADWASWTKDLSVCSASGSVDAVFGHHALKAASAEFFGDSFTAEDVERYEDKSRRLVMTSGSVRGTLVRGALSELSAQGGVDIEMPDARGEVSNVAGDRGLFSVARGTIVITGNASAIQLGRQLHAGSIVYWLDSGRVEAVERPSLILESLE